MPANYEDWAEFELQFLIETYPSKAWTVLTIAEKLDRSINSIHQKAFALEIKRPSRTFPHRNDPAFISDLKKQQPIRQITSRWGCSKAEVDRGRARLKAQGEAA